MAYALAMKAAATLGEPGQAMLSSTLFVVMFTVLLWEEAPPTCCRNSGSSTTRLGSDRAGLTPRGLDPLDQGRVDLRARLIRAV